MFDTTENGTAGALIRKDSVQELCAHRARALELYAQAYRLLQEAQKTHRRACIGNATISDLPRDWWRYPEYSGGVEGFIRQAQERVDRDMWRSFIINTPLGSLMDAEERKRFEDSLEKTPPEATPENVEASLRRLAGEAGLIFRRGLVNVFSALCGKYRSHDGFKIGDRVVLTYAFTVYSDKTLGTFRRDDTLRDVERVFYVLDGKELPAEYNAGICGKIRTASHAQLRECEDDYLSVRWFKNGNMHIRFKRLDLVEKANKLIAEHYGQTVGAGPDARRRA